MAKRKHTSTKEKAQKSAKNTQRPDDAYQTSGGSRIWMVVSFVLLVALILSLLLNGNSTPKEEVGIGTELAGQKAVEFVNTQLGGQATAELNSIEDGEKYYLASFNISGQPMSAYVTKDGKYLIPSTAMLDMDAVATQPEQPTQATQPVPDVEKMDMPSAEVFVMSHCPFGTQIEKGVLPVMELLGDKADIKIKFVNYAMHGEKEVVEQLNQYCIQEEQSDKFIPYLKCFLEAGDGEGCLAKTGIDTTALKTCTTRVDSQYNIMANLADEASWLNGRFPKFMIHDAENQLYEVRGSPTLVINGKQVSAGRDSASLLAAVCAGFNNPPAECEQELSATSPGPGFGFDSTGGTAAAQCG